MEALHQQLAASRSFEVTVKQIINSIYMLLSQSARTSSTPLWPRLMSLMYALTPAARIAPPPVGTAPARGRELNYGGRSGGEVDGGWSDRGRRREMSRRGLCCSDGGEKMEEDKDVSREQRTKETGEKGPEKAGVKTGVPIWD